MRKYCRPTALDLFIRQRAQRLEAGYNRGADFEADAEEIRLRILEGSLPEGFENELRNSYERLAGPEGAAISVRSSALVEDSRNTPSPVSSRACST